MLGMARQQLVSGVPHSLYAATAPALAIYVYLRGGALAEALYRYDAQQHRLVAVAGMTAAQLEQAYTPYNRKHFKQASFCLFLFGHCGSADARQSALHAALLDAGSLGQLLLERQAEFDLGLCPIGAIRLGPIAHAFDLAPGMELLHSFTGGVSHRDVPASRQRIEALAGPGQQADPVQAHRADAPGVAIIGMSGRFPGASDAAQLWRNLLAGVNSIGPLPAGRQAGSASAPAGGYLPDVACFDSLLFGIAPVEARTLDPQERLLLEEVWAALEDAGYTAPGLAATGGRVGVYVGAMWNDYQSIGLDTWRATGVAEECSHHASLANRISHVFDFSGPSVATNTSCASGITALHLASESIRRGECDAAIVGGVNLLGHPYHGQLLSSLGLLSSDGCARPMSAEASGWAPGEGVGVVVLKSLRSAERDGDHIHAILHASYIGHSGKSMRYGAPNALRQAGHLRQLLANAALAPADIGYIEAAAPGSILADAAELNAINEVFGTADRPHPCFVGSVKGNIGHLESASGMSQLAKVVLQLRHHRLAPVLNSEPRNPLIALDERTLSVVTAPTPWPADAAGVPRYALINSIGAAGSVGHLIVAEYIPPMHMPPKTLPGSRHLVVLSAATAEQLQVRVRRLLDFLAAHADTSIADLAYTLRSGRVAMTARLALVADSVAALCDRLQALLAAGAAPGVWRGMEQDDGPAQTLAGSDDPERVAAAWVQGHAVDWHRFDRPGQRRIALPVYPFEAVRHWLDGSPVAAPAGHSPGRADVEERTHAYLMQQLAQVTGIPLSRITVDRPLEEFGINSMIIEQFHVCLVHMFAAVPKTVLFEHRNLRSLAAWLVRTYGATPCAMDSGAGAEACGPLAVAAAPSAPPAMLRSAPAAGAGIAIVGLAGRYPQAETLDIFWRNLAAGTDSIEEVPRERWDALRHTGADGGPRLSKWGGFLRDADTFDPLFFNISPLEAERMDPQERLLLQAAWHALEDAGYSRSALAARDQGKVGVFVGVMGSEYQLFSSHAPGQGVSGSYGTIANRVSYVLNLRGPSMAVDTMCSSSLTAIHLACESIRRGESACAIVGGVSLSLHPNKYTTHALLNMPSSHGRCHSFGAGGDGFVAGEGVGAALLKPLDQALADGDHIYAVIQGTAVNHGGKTNGYTVPDPQAQQELVAAALHHAGVNARTISYVEAHGTGTALGDPIEIAGLGRAFGAHTEARQFCAIGSVKSNIGHAEAAAGIAGLTKVLLQMRHGQLVPSLHSKQPNPNIDFAATPFTVQQELAEWVRPVVEIDGVRREYPRIAGISSFGAGGANAHLIVQEYRPASPQAVARLPAGHMALVVLSARNAERLRAGVQQLLAAVEQGVVSDDNLADAAYTLQVGREAMEVRMALAVPGVTALGERLREVLRAPRIGDTACEHVYYGETRQYRDEMAALAADDDWTGLIAAWLAKGKHGKLLELWVKGAAWDWNHLYGDRLPGRISLPVYPFARERYWLPQGQAPATLVRERAAMLHPLVHSNISDFSAQRYSSRFDGQEFFLADHRIQGRKVLPGVAYLEMVRVALRLASGQADDAAITVCLRNVVWSRPLVIDEQPAQVVIALHPHDGALVSYEIAGEDQAGAVRYSQGSIEATTAAAPVTIDLAAVRAQCSAAQWSADDCYARFAASGLQYGPAHQALDCLYLGQQQVLGRLVLPAVLAGTGVHFGLHPSLLDAALQSLAGLIAPADTAVAGQSSVPFALEQLDVLSACTEQMWVVARRSGGSQEGGQGSGPVQKFDLDLCDDDGRVCVRLRGLSTRILEVAPVDEQGQAARAAPAILLLEPAWQAAPAAPAPAPVYQEHLVLLCDGDIDVTTQPAHPGRRYEVLAGDYAAQAAMLLGHLQALRPAAPVLLQLVVSAAGPQQLSAGLAGLLKSARLEHPNLVGQVIMMAQEEHADQLAARLEENSRHPDDALVAYLDGQRQVLGWREPDAALALQPWQAGGVYLITGGMGGLGRIFAREIAGQVVGARLVLTGRRQLDDISRQQLRELQALGALVQYQVLDVADRAAVEQLVAQVLGDFGALNGIVHCAGVLRDSLLGNKTPSELAAVLAPKVAGLINLDHASRQIALDCFLCCSSITAALGNVGQTDYAAGNAFMDAFAAYRATLVAGGERHGRTLSLNWPLWQDGGMRIAVATERAMTVATGLVALPTASGIAALYRAWGSGAVQIAVLAGDPARTRQLLAAPVRQTAQAAAPAPELAGAPGRPGLPGAALREKTGRYLRQLVARTLHLPLERIELDAALEQYGINSIMVMDLTTELESVFGSLSKTLFFEYQNLQSLAGYFLAHHAAQLLRLLGDATPEPASAAASASAAVQSRLARPQYRSSLTAPASHPAPSEAVAIIGVAGRYPQAPDLAAFWQNLRDGRDCITEIPSRRWDHAPYYDQDKDKPGKTCTKWGGFIDGVDEFDPLFFGISPRDAELIDPQERLFLQCAYAALEDAGYTRETLARYQASGMPGNVGVYVGVMYEEYQLFAAEQQLLGNPVTVSSSPASIANRVSYFLNLHGPSMAVDTMCSSSLTAIHLACESLQRGGCEMAIAGGVNVSIHPNKYLMLGQGK
ncbi:SDR family NAD(P)-dependent oxidoreductase, partial [Janthinobacterium sp.]|uniref:SDR family NAD(P)-dependent oxidoreductase n=1 Tax=Janthinobacterium sp. TaxID=1871054 RepID=UPI00258D07C6